MTDDDAGSSASAGGRRPSSGRTRPSDDDAPTVDDPSAEDGAPAAGSGALAIGDGVPPTASGASGTPVPPGGRAGVPGRRTAILGALASGLVGAVFGTLLHGQILTVGGVQLPVGAVAALALAGSLFLYCGLWARSVIMTAVAGATAYGVVALLSTSSKILIVTESEAAPTLAFAGNLWLFGVLVVTVGAVAVAGVILRPGRQR